MYFLVLLVMRKRTFTEEERKRRIEYQRLYGLQKSQDKDWREREARRRMVS
jgi:hypothetical protein